MHLTPRMSDISLIVRLDDILTGFPAWPGDISLKVSSQDGYLRPVAKGDGYFVFVGSRPDVIRVQSEIYGDFSFKTGGVDARVLRISLIKRGAPSKNAYNLPLEPGSSAHIGFKGAKCSYPLIRALKAGDSEIALQKDDLLDITNLFHILSSPEAGEEPIFLSGSLGYGRYALLRPAAKDYPLRATRLLPLRRIVGSAGDFVNVPTPCEYSKIFIMRGDPPGEPYVVD